MSVNEWSTTAADNATADSNINWQENQNPNTVNDSARAMMAAIAAFLEQTNGTVATGGSSNAYTVTSPTGHAFASYLDGIEIAFIANHSNTGAATLNVDGLGATAIKKRGTVDVAAGDIISGALIRVIYDGTNFQLHSQAGGDGFPSGTRMLFQQTAAPSGWTKDTTANLNNTALRVVTGAVSNRTSGDDFTTVFAAAKSTASSGASTTGGTAASISNTNLGLSVQNTSLTESQLPAHDHLLFAAVDAPGGSPTNLTGSTSVAVQNSGGGNYQYVMRSGGGSPGLGVSGAAGSGSGHNHGLSGSTGNHSHSSPSHTHTTPNHTHTTDLDVNYHDVIICIKA